LNQSVSPAAGVFPGGKMPPSTAGKDACRYIFKQALNGSWSGGRKIEILCQIPLPAHI
jgi:hypothetical protein